MRLGRNQTLTPNWSLSLLKRLVSINVMSKSWPLGRYVGRKIVPIMCQGVWDVRGLNLFLPVFKPKIVIIRNSRTFRALFCMRAARAQAKKHWAEQCTSMQGLCTETGL